MMLILWVLLSVFVFGAFETKVALFPVLTFIVYLCVHCYWPHWPQSASELYRPTDSRFSAKLVPNIRDIGCRVVSAMDPCFHILGFLYRSRYFFFQVAPQLYSRGWVPGSAMNRTRTSWSVARNSDHYHRVSSKLHVLLKICRHKCDYN
jgi:hypothetical protein